MHDLPVDLVAQADAVVRVSPDVAAEYDCTRDLLAGRAVLALLEQAATEAILGLTPPRLLQDQQREHGATVGSVLRYGSGLLLLRTTLWAYRAYRSRGVRTEYFPAMAAAWRTAARAHLSLDAAAAVGPVYDWLIERHEALLSLAESQAAVAAPAALPTPYPEFTAALLRGDERTCVRIALEHGATADAMPGFCLNVLQPAMHEVGRRWELDRVPLMRLHLANAIGSRVLAAIGLRVRLPDVTKGRVIIASCQGEFHELGGRVLCDLLELAGWEADFLGADTPTAAVVRMVDDVRPHVVGISVSLAGNLGYAGDTIAALRERPEFADVRILVGGLGLWSVPDLWRQLGADGTAPDGAAAVALADRWWEGSRDLPA